MEEEQKTSNANAGLEDLKGKANGLWQKVLFAYKYNPYETVRDTPIVCPTCQTENLAIAVSCKECGNEFKYKPAKSAWSMGLALPASIFLLLVSWIVWLCSRQGSATSNVAAVLWLASVGAIVGAVAIKKMKHWGWKLVSLSALCWECLFLCDASGPVIGLLGGLLILSPLIAASWMGYKSMVELGQYLDEIHRVKSYTTKSEKE